MSTKGFIGTLTIWSVAAGGLLCVIAAVFLPPESPYALPRYFWYVDFRFWPSWVSWCCWLVLFLVILSTLLRLFVPASKRRLSWRRQSGSVVASLLCLGLFSTMLGADSAVQPKKVETSVG
ncbi:MAG: hypothetical protein ACRC46_05185, partial [Thermoguttaceae bacterium]